LTNALENMKTKGRKLSAATVTEWLDCGNKDATVFTNKRLLEIKKDAAANHTQAANVINSVIVEPCFIGKDVKIENSVVGPYVSIGKNTSINNCVIRNSIIQTDSVVSSQCIDNSMIGSFTKLEGKLKELSIGDYTTEK